MIKLNEKKIYFMLKIISSLVIKEQLVFSDADLVFCL